MLTVELHNLRNAWLSPQGELINDHDEFYSDGAWHESLAQCLVKDLLSIRVKFDVIDQVRSTTGHAYCYTLLEERGWIRLQTWPGTTKSKWVVGDFMTPAQREVIENWCLENNVLWSDTVEVVL